MEPDYKKDFNHLMDAKLCKRLLSASRLGIVFDYQDGHRWLSFLEPDLDNCTSFKSICEKLNVYPNEKVYGCLFECLEIIDIVLNKYDGSSLESRFDLFNDWFYEDSPVINNKDFLIDRIF